MQKNEFIPFELALRMKNIGYDIESSDLYFYSWGNIATSNKKYERIGGLYNFWKDTDEDGSFSHQVFKCPGCGNFDDHFVYAPLFQQAFRWFREKYKIHGILYPYSETVSGKFGWVIFFIGETKDGHVTEMIRSPRPLNSMVDREAGDDSYWNFEESELACIEKLIELVEQKQKENGEI